MMALRARLPWLLVAAAVAFALVSVAVYYSTKTFSDGWLLASAVFYGIILVVAIAFAMMERDAPAGTATSPTGPLGDPKLLERLVTYRSRDGMAVRLDYLWPDGAREMRHVAITPGEMLTLHDIEAHVDAFPDADPQDDLEKGIEDALGRFAWKEPKVMTIGDER
jgi:hypothetical protein